MKKVKKLMMYALAGALIFTACKKDDEEPTPTTPSDSTKPTLTLTAPAANLGINAGAILHIEGTAKDETDLASVKISISGAFAQDSTVTVVGKEAAFKLMLPIPATVTGAASVSVTAIDAAGNESDAATAAITVKAADKVKPVINSVKVISPASGDLESGSTPNKVEFDISDNMELGEIKLVLHNTSLNPAKDIWTKTISASANAGKKAYKETVDVTFSGSAVAGTNDAAKWKVTVKDAAGNEATFEQNVTIKY
jgi:hypothetical protein